MKGIEMERSKSRCQANSCTGYYGAERRSELSQTFGVTSMRYNWTYLWELLRGRACKENSVPFRVLHTPLLNEDDNPDLTASAHEEVSASTSCLLHRTFTTFLFPMPVAYFDFHIVSTIQIFHLFRSSTPSSHILWRLWRTSTFTL